MERPLSIPKLKKWKGLTVYCYKCKTNVSEICKGTGKTIERCPFGERHIFKVYVHVKGTANERKTKKLETRDLDEAIRQAIEFQKKVNEITYETENTDQNNETEKQAVPELLIEALARDIGRLNNEGVAEHRVKERSNDHIKDVERAFKVLLTCLKAKGYNLRTLRMDQLTDKMAGFIYSHLINQMGFKGRTINKYLSHYTSFITRHNQEYNVEIQNFFETSNRIVVNHTPVIIPNKETFEAFLKKITPENGIKEYASGKKPKRNVYRSWLSNAFRLALETGRRREEIINLKFSNIIKDSNGISYIKVEDYKVNRIANRFNDTEKKYIFIPVTTSLNELLQEMDYEKFKDTENYILAPELKMNRKRSMSDVLSHGFSHFYSQLNTGKKLTFKSLRKTYITNLSIYMGGNAKAITGHSDDSVIEKHYLDKQALVKAAKGFEVFPSETNRKNELEQHRNSKSNQSQKIELEQ